MKSLRYCRVSLGRKSQSVFHTSNVFKYGTTPLVRKFCSGKRFFENQKLQQFQVQDSKIVEEEEVVNDSDAEKEALFKDLGSSGKISNVLTQALAKAKFVKMTKIQQEGIIPMIESESGIVCRAKTGTGKTLAFIIPSLQKAIETENLGTNSVGVQTLVVAPTRDLALQIENEYKHIVKFIPRKYLKNFNIALCIGQVRFNFNKYVTPSVIIATPGKLNALLQDKYNARMFKNLQYRIYDEADRLLDQGFSEELDSIDKNLRAIQSGNEKVSFRSVLFSATIDDRVVQFAKDQIGESYKFINTVDPNEPEAHKNIYQSLVLTNNVGESFNASLRYLQKKFDDENFKAIVFLPTKSATTWYKDALDSLCPTKDHSFNAKTFLLNGDMTQSKRNAIVKRFRTARSGILVTTDVAARGLDIKNVSHVVQLGPSSSHADYIHKIGRTARAGKSGKAILFLSKPEINFRRTLQEERGVEFSEVHDCKFDEEDLKALESLNSSEESMEDFLKKSLAAYGQFSALYKINFRTYADGVSKYYKFLMKDPTAKLFMSTKFIREICRMNPEEAANYFNFPSMGDRRSNNRRSKMTFMNSFQGSNQGKYSSRSNYRKKRY